MVGRPWQLLGLASAVGLGFDLLFWEQTPGLNVALFIALVAAVLLAGARWEGVRPHPRALALLVPTGLLALGVALRDEPGTAALDAMLALALLGLFAQTLRDGAWAGYGLRDYLLAGLRLTGGVALGTARLPAAAVAQTPVRPVAAGRRIAPVVRGVAVALPLLAFFSVLLGSADPVFAARLGDALAWLQPDAPDEVVLRAAVVATVGAVAGGLTWYALTRPAPVLLGGTPLGRRIGAVEAGIVLGSVDALFATFVAVQLRAAFGGSSYVAAAGLTYAEYARRGFAELVVVAAASLLLLLALAGTTRRDAARQRRWFSLLAAGLTGLVLVILASAFQRLLLYEEAFGFTRLRTYAHVFMVWLGLLLLAVLVMELRGRLRAFTTACITAAVGFALTLTVLNVDATIAARNIARFRAGEQLDASYLARLSTDAVPTLVAAERDAPPALQQRLADALGCAAAAAERPLTWQSFTWSQWQARRALAARPPDDRSCPPYD